VLHCVATCCSVLQRVASVYMSGSIHGVLCVPRQGVAGCCSVLQCVASVYMCHCTAQGVYVSVYVCCGIVCLHRCVCVLQHCVFT